MKRDDKDSNVAKNKNTREVDGSCYQHVLNTEWLIIIHLREKPLSNLYVCLLPKLNRLNEEEW